MELAFAGLRRSFHVLKPNSTLTRSLSTLSPIQRHDLNTQLRGGSVSDKDACAIVTAKYFQGTVTPSNPSKEHTLRYFESKGGGDGGGMELYCTSHSLSKLYELPESFFDKKEGSIIQAIIHPGDTYYKNLIKKFKSHGYTVIKELYPETTMDSLEEPYKTQHGILIHIVIKRPEDMSVSQFQNEIGKLTTQFNIEEQEQSIENPLYEPADIFGYGSKTILLKSFQSSKLLEIFPFAKDLRIEGSSWHGREATNTAVRFTNIQGTKGGVKHNGEDNAVEPLKMHLAYSKEFRQYLEWTKSPDALRKVLDRFSDSHLNSMAEEFQRYKGQSQEEILTEKFKLPFTLPSTKREYIGPGFYTTGGADDTPVYAARDTHCDRPADIWAYYNKEGDCIAYTLSSLPKVPLSEEFSLPEGGYYRKIDLAAGSVIKIEKKESGFYFTYCHTEHPIENVWTLGDNGEITHTGTEEKQSLSESLIYTETELESTKALHKKTSLADLKIAMASLKEDGNPLEIFKRVAAQVTNRAYNPDGFHTGSILMPLQIESNTLYIPAVLSHSQFQTLTRNPKFVSVSAMIPTKKALSLTEEELENYITELKETVKREIDSGVTSIAIEFVGEGSPLSPKELIINELYKTIEESGRDVSLIAVAPAYNHCQDAYRAITAGADFFYDPHLESKSKTVYKKDLEAFRHGLLELSYVSGITNLRQLKGTLRFYTENQGRIAARLNIRNVGLYPKTDLGSFTRDVAKMGLATGIDFKDREGHESAPIMNSELARGIQSPTSYKEAFKKLRENKATRGYFGIISLRALPEGTLPLNIAVVGAGGAGTLITERIIENGKARVFLIDINPFNTLGSVTNVAGDHLGILTTTINRQKASLENPNVHYLGGLSEPQIQALLSLMDTIYDTRGTKEVPSPAHQVSAKEYLAFAHGRGPKPRNLNTNEGASIVCIGSGQVTRDIMLMHLGNDDRACRAYQEWMEKYTQRPLIQLYRNGIENTSMDVKDYEMLIQKAKEAGLPISIYYETPNEETLKAMSADKQKKTRAILEIIAPYKVPFTDFIAPKGLILIYGFTEDKIDQERYIIKGKTGSIEIANVGGVIQGFVPMKTQSPIIDGIPTHALGWSESSGNLAEIEKRTLSLPLPDRKKILNQTTWLEREKRKDELTQQMTQIYPIRNKEQLLLLQLLSENPNLTPAEFKKALEDSQSTKGSASTTPHKTKQEIPWDHFHTPGEESFIIGRLENGKLIQERIDYRPGSEETFFTALTRGKTLTNTPFKTGCGGEGTCSDCVGQLETPIKPTRGEKGIQGVVPSGNYLCFHKASSTKIFIPETSVLYQILNGKGKK